MRMEGGQGLEVEEVGVGVVVVAAAAEQEDLLVASFDKRPSAGLRCHHGLSHTYR